MKARISAGHAVVFTLLFAAAGLMFTGCRTTPRVDWNNRVGTYTYDDAVAELGPPDKTATTSDGKLVADWITRYSGGGLSFGVGTGRSSGNSAVGVGVGSSTGYQDKVLRLTFGPDHKLIAWSKNY
jgi:hypothetical protein